MLLQTKCYVTFPRSIDGHVHTHTHVQQENASTTNWKKEDTKAKTTPWFHSVLTSCIYSFVFVRSFVLSVCIEKDEKLCMAGHCGGGGCRRHCRVQSLCWMEGTTGEFDSLSRPLCLSMCVYVYVCVCVQV